MESQRQDSEQRDNIPYGREMNIAAAQGLNCQPLMTKAGGIGI